MFTISKLFHLGPLLCRNFPNDANTIATFEGRNFNKQHLKRTLANGQTVDRDWVIYSPSKNSLLCFVCRLLRSTKSSDVFVTPGLIQFHNIIRDLKAYENSKNHVLNELAYKQRAKEIDTLTLDTSITIKTEIEKKYWRSILKRVVAVIKFLGSRGQPFRGANQTCGSLQNGNFLGILDLISQFDPLMATHIAKHENQGRGIIFLSSFVSELSVNPFEL